MGTQHFVKLWASLLDSSLWEERDVTLRTFVALLLLADSDGRVEITLPGLIRRVARPRDDVLDALDRLGAVDPESGSPVECGRRILPLTDRAGWSIVNYAAYRNLQTRGQAANAARQARARERRKGSKQSRERSEAAPGGGE